VQVDELVEVVELLEMEEVVVVVVVKGHGNVGTGVGIQLFKHDIAQFWFHEGSRLTLWTRDSQEPVVIPQSQ
jgi:hypothetical protein